VDFPSVLLTYIAHFSVNLGCLVTGTFRDLGHLVMGHLVMGRMVIWAVW
jgi:hypothetical protein